MVCTCVCKFTSNSATARHFTLVNNERGELVARQCNSKHGCTPIIGVGCSNGDCSTALMCNRRPDRRRKIHIGLIKVGNTLRSNTKKLGLPVAIGHKVSDYLRVSSCHLCLVGCATKR